MIYENWKSLKPLTAPVPVGTKVVVVSRYAVPCGAIGSVQWSNDKGIRVCFEENYSRYYTFSALALLPTQSTMTEQEKWQFGGIDLDACECVEHDGKRYPLVKLDRCDTVLVLLFSIGDTCFLCEHSEINQVISAHYGTISRLCSDITLIPKKQAPTTRPWNQDEMLELVRKGGVELCDKNGWWVSAGDYQIDPSGGLNVSRCSYDAYTHYRSQETNWESQPLTKVVE